MLDDQVKGKGERKDAERDNKSTTLWSLVWVVNVDQNLSDQPLPPYGDDMDDGIETEGKGDT